MKNVYAAAGNKNRNSAVLPPTVPLKLPHSQSQQCSPSHSKVNAAGLRISSGSQFLTLDMFVDGGQSSPHQGSKDIVHEESSCSSNQGSSKSRRRPSSGSKRDSYARPSPSSNHNKAQTLLLEPNRSSSRGKRAERTRRSCSSYNVLSTSNQLEGRHDTLSSSSHAKSPTNKPDMAGSSSVQIPKKKRSRADSKLRVRTSNVPGMAKTESRVREKS